MRFSYLVFHTVGGVMGVMHEDIYNNPNDFDEVTDIYHDWISGPTTSTILLP